MTGTTPQTVRAGTVDVAYEESGKGEPLILVHGAESDRHQFDRLRTLLGPDIRAISYDQRDTGDTRNPDLPYTIDDLADDLAGLIVALGLETAHLLGTSYGGMVAMATALRYPGRVHTVSLVSTAPNRGFIGPVAAELPGLNPAERARVLLDLLFTPEGQEAAARRVLTPRPACLSARRLAAAEGFDVLDRLGELSVPTLVLHGTDDRLVLPDAPHAMDSRIPGARLEFVQGGRHGLSTEFPETVARLVRETVRSHPLLTAGSAARHPRGRNEDER
jgi:pimeloyl-ACP methyl ester carboxylesterase